MIEDKNLNDKEIDDLLKSRDAWSLKVILIAFVTLIFLAFLGRPAEMTVIAGFTGLILAFLNLHQFSEFSALGFVGKLRAVAQKTNAMAERQTEYDVDETTVSPKGEILKLSGIQLSILNSIANSQYTFRTVSGLADELGKSKASVLKSLKDLQDIGIVDNSTASGRRTVWSISSYGKHVLKALNNASN